MPPSLYFYVNFTHIEHNEAYSNTKKIMRPSLSDLEWEFFYNWTECRGFSGFEEDLEESSNLLLTNPIITDEFLLLKAPETLTPFGTRKKFVKPSEALRKHHPYHKGKALYRNEAKNLMLMGSRDTGKSYMVGLGVALHQFLMDGATSYDEETIKSPSRIEIAVGAETSARSTLMLNKVRLAMDLLPGSMKIAGKYYPAPFSKRFRGSWAVGKEIVAEYDKKMEGGWVTAGSRSEIKHRTFNDNPFAVQGGRELAIILEEVGLMNNLKQVFANTKDNLRKGTRKTGSLVMLGTGGDMEGKGTLDAYEMFYSPTTYDILAFEDKWENRGSIAMFVPAEMSLRDFKDERGFTIWDASAQEIMASRDKAKNSKGGSFALNKEIMYRPRVPSEMFLSKSSNIFPTTELTRRLSEIIDQTHHLQNKVHLLFDPSSPYNGVYYKIDDTLEPIDQFPYPDEGSKEGAVVIYEFPQQVDGVVPNGAYIIGCDPYKDDGQEGESFASIYVVKTSKYPTVVGYDQIVASYIGRPYLGKNQVNEILHKLSLFYGNAKIYFENAVGNVKDYFEKIHKLDLLALQPNTVFNKKASFNTPISMIYGYPMSNQKIKWEALQYVRQWLLEPRDNNYRNLDLIPDRFLLQQLIAFNMEGNFDAVMGLVGAIIGLEEINNLNKRKEIVEETQSELEKEFDKLIVHNKRLFYEKFSSTKTFF